MDTSIAAHTSIQSEPMAYFLSETQQDFLATRNCSPNRPSNMALPTNSVHRTQGITSPRSLSTLFDSTPSVLFHPVYSGEDISRQQNWSQKERDQTVALDVMRNLLSPTNGTSTHSSTHIFTDEISNAQIECVGAQDVTPTEEVSYARTECVGAKDVTPTVEVSYAQIECVGAKDQPTMYMLANVPNRYTTDMLMDEFETQGLLCEIDYFYMPIDYQRKRNGGYCFVNLTSNDAVKRFRQAFDGMRMDKFGTVKTCRVLVGKLQGVEENIAAYYQSLASDKHKKSRPLRGEGGKFYPLPPKHK